MNEMRILIVDDETEFTHTLAERLTIRGFSVNTATDGETALSMIENNRFDAILLDYLMPGLSGVETLKRIRELTPEVPVFLLTGHGSTKEGIEGMRTGARDFLMKPIDIDELVQKLNDL